MFFCSLRSQKGGKVVHFRALPENEPPLLFCERSEHQRFTHFQKYSRITSSIKIQVCVTSVSYTEKYKFSINAIRFGKITKFVAE
jgi:hypothetical protein